MKENGRWPGFYLSRIQGTRVLIPTAEGEGVLLLFDQRSSASRGKSGDRGISQTRACNPLQFIVTRYNPPGRPLAPNHVTCYKARYCPTSFVGQSIHLPDFPRFADGWPQNLTRRHLNSFLSTAHLRSQQTECVFLQQTLPSARRVGEHSSLAVDGPLGFLFRSFTTASMPPYRVTYNQRNLLTKVMVPLQICNEKNIVGMFLRRFVPP